MKFQGLSTSKGVAFGSIYVLRKIKPDVSYRLCEDVDQALYELQVAIQKAKVQLTALKERTREKIGENESRIFDAHRLIVEDPDFLKTIETIIKTEQVTPAYGVDKARKQFEALFLAMDNAYMRERAADINDVSNRLIKNIYNIVDDTEIPDDAIIVCEDLEPSDTASLDAERIAGIVTQKGGETSHSAIIAKSLSIPAITKIELGCLDEVAGKAAIIDALDGILIIDPSAEIVEHYKGKKERYEASLEVFKKGMFEPAVSKDGHVVEVAANIASVELLESVLATGADGVGLFRTEFLYMNRCAAPEVEEQFEAYKKVLLAFGDKPVVIRTFDIGGDKKIDYLDLPEEDNPFLGYRAIRISLDRQSLFRVQIKALLMASPFGNLKIMFPMISSIEEIKAAKAIVADVAAELMAEGYELGRYEVGMMVEIPSVAVMADMFAKHVDFFSIGTNDLLQYTIAVDRMNEKLTHLYSWYHPALLDLIRRVSEAGRRNGIWTGICGEAASDPNLLPFYMSVGIKELSMSPSKVAEVKWAVRQMTMEKAYEIADTVKQMETAEEIDTFLKSKSKSK